MDRIATKAVKIHFLIQDARAVSSEVEAARQERWEQEFARRKAAHLDRVAREKPGELNFDGVVALVREAGHAPATWDKWQLYGQAKQLGVITDLEFEVLTMSWTSRTD